MNKQIILIIQYQVQKTRMTKKNEGFITTVIKEKKMILIFINEFLQGLP